MRKLLTVIAVVALIIAFYSLHLFILENSFLPHGKMHVPALAKYLGKYEPISPGDKKNVSIYITMGTLYIDGVGQYPLGVINRGWIYGSGEMGWKQIRTRTQFDGKILTSYRREGEGFGFFNFTPCGEMLHATDFIKIDFENFPTIEVTQFSGDKQQFRLKGYNITYLAGYPGNTGGHGLSYYQGTACDNNEERDQFSGSTNEEKKINCLYHKIIDMEPTQDELDYWYNMNRQGLDVNSIKEQFYNASTGLNGNSWNMPIYLEKN